MAVEQQGARKGGCLQIINLAKNIKTPSLTVYLVGDAARDREAAKNVQCSLEYTTLRRVTEATEIHYDPDPEASPHTQITTLLHIPVHGQ